MTPRDIPTRNEPPDDFEEMLAGFDRIIHDKDLQQQLLDAGLLVRVEPEADAASPAALPEHEKEHWPHMDGSGRWCRICDPARRAASPAALDVERAARVIHSMEHARWADYESCPKIMDDRATASMFVSRYARLSPSEGSGE